MGKLIFKNTNNEFNREMSNIEFIFPDDINIKELKTIFIRMASAMGYQEKSIKDTLGEPEHDEYNFLPYPHFGKPQDGDINMDGEDEYHTRNSLFNGADELFSVELDDFLDKLDIDKTDKEDE